MGVPATLADLDPIAANNSPSGSDPIGTNLDDYIRAHAALIKQAYTGALIPSGTRMPFAQASAPTGWTQDTSDSADNRMLRVTKLTGGGVAGSHSPILMNVIPSHTHDISVYGSGAHTHAISDPGHSHVFHWGNTDGSIPNPGVGAWGNNSTSYTDSAATGISINWSDSHTHAASSSAPSGASNWTPRYIDMIICSKN